MKRLLPFLVLVLLVGLGAYFYVNRSGESGSNPLSTITSQGENAPKSLRELMALTNNQECTFSDDQGNSGMVYTSGGKMRGDFVSATGEETMVSHVFTDGNDMYMWFDGAEQGMKMSLEAMTEAGEEVMEATKDLEIPKSTEPEQVNLDEEVDFQCKNWRVDSSIFELPDLEFTDFSAMMDGVMEDVMDGIEGMEKEGDEAVGDLKEVMSAQCGTCDTLPIDAAAQCRQALGC